ncbi:hypothetical protein ONE63_000266 [Megalurothrips usitatus]|uniref:Chorein N-terminal domain-containing protein n=1 Tax=Megalurothrips usitatus TaxID=439358 RepID=A0AAV7Y1S8_9NEOP|nr:hypothetical protein ONE63_000266 [Megalurothrips usitatus]
MFEGVVAALLNRFLGKYVQDLDTEHLNVGIFGGDVQLHNLRLRPEALYELDLPIEVKAGTIGRVSLNIPWSGLYTESVVVTVEDVYVVAGPVIQGPYDAERDKRLLRAAKKRVLSDWLGDAMGDSLGESLVTTVMNNLQVRLHKINPVGVPRRGATRRSVCKSSSVDRSSSGTSISGTRTPSCTPTRR